MADQHQAHRGGHMLDQVKEGIVNGAGADRLVIVQHEGEWSGIGYEQISNGEPPLFAHQIGQAR